jgi:CubicO group peptidase (beta-lactamase class C family)
MEALRSGTFRLSLGGSVVAEGAFGSCVLSARCQASSISKQFVAASLMLLVERGTVSLNDPVSSWWSPAPTTWDAMTVGHLLAHSSGLPHWPDMAELDILHPPSRDEILSRAAQGSLLHRPGESFHYSGVGYLLAAAVIEVASDQPYASFVADQILDPLGLTSTTTGQLPEVRIRAMGHRDGSPVEWDPGLVALPGTGDLWSTVADLIQFTEALEAGRLLSESSLRAMRQPHIPIEGGTDAGVVSAYAYGYGIYLGWIDGQPARYHPGDNPGFLSLLAWLPESHTALAVLVNDEATVLDDVVLELLRTYGAVGGSTR